LQIRKIAITASMENESWTPENPKMDPKKVVRIATTDGTWLLVMAPLLDLTETVPREEAAEDFEEAVADHVVALEAAVVVVAARETLTENPEMTKRELQSVSR
jgi:hypothetical protein